MDFSNLDYTRVAAVSSEIKVADIDFNCNEIIETLKVLASKNVSIACFQELTLCGYSCGDLFFSDTLLKECIESLIKLKEFSNELEMIFIIGLPIQINTSLFNAAAVIYKGQILGLAIKSHLPNYNEFYEKRWFSPASEIGQDSLNIDGNLVQIGNDLIFNTKDFKFGVEICEDLWVSSPVSTKLAGNGAEVIFNLSAGNELLFKKSYRKNLVLNQAAITNSAYVYAGANPSESSTDVTYSGHLIISDNGRLSSESRKFQFETDFIYSDIDLGAIRNNRIKLKDLSKNSFDTHRDIDFNFYPPKLESLSFTTSKTPFIPENLDLRNEICDEIITIQSTALAKRLKHIGVKNVTIGISGGLDSCLALIVCVQAFNKLGLSLKGIHSIVMPGPGSSKKTQSNAELLSKLFETTFIKIDISNAVESHLIDLDHSNHNYDITFENAQARERTQILMDYANKINGITIGTGDLSELALGWCTYNADQVSMYGVNSGVPKTLVKHIIDYFAKTLKNKELSQLLKEIINQPISPELIPANIDDSISQLTESKVGPYILNDFFLFYFLRYNFSIKKIYYLAICAFDGDYTKNDILFWLEKFIKRFFNNQFKRSLMPDGIKVGSVALSPRADLRMPSDANYSTWIKELEKLKEL